MSLVIFVLILGASVIVHELGHFLAARGCGILVEEFAIGMGPILLSKKKGDTLYSIRLFPIGGFCKMLGEEGGSDDGRSYTSKKVYQRALVSVAGAVMNLMLALLICIGIILVNGYAQPVVSTTEAGSPADIGGLLPGDKIISLDNTKIRIYDDLAFEMENYKNYRAQKDIPVKVTFLRDNVRFEKNILPRKNQNGDYKFGFYPDYKTGLLSERVESYSVAGLLDTLYVGFFTMTGYVKMILSMLLSLIVKLFTGQPILDNLAGPIGMAYAIDETYKTTIVEGIRTTALTMFNIAALLSANLGVFNLLPLPALDGGRLLFLLVESVRRKPVNPEREGFIHFVGLVLLMILAAAIALLEIKKYVLA